MPRTIKITLEYDGTNYVGWQRQAAGTSVQGLLEEALAAFEGRPVAVHGAGRTDAGAHATGQVASVSLDMRHDLRALERGLNVALPPDVRVLRVEEAPPAFHARFSARGKVYQYRIVSGPVIGAFEFRYAWHVPGRLAVAPMREAAALLVGRHDFAAFQAVGASRRTTVRTITAIDLKASSDEAVERDRPNRASLPLSLTVEGNGFLRHMVRIVAGTLVEIGLGRWPPARIVEILDTGDRQLAGRTAPARGLTLLAVVY